MLKPLLLFATSAALLIGSASIAEDCPSALSIHGDLSHQHAQTEDSFSQGKHPVSVDRGFTPIGHWAHGQKDFWNYDGEGAAGVGMEINQDRAGHFIVKRLELQGPAEQSKVLVGDRILQVNGTSVDGLHMSEVVKLVRGNVRTEVKLQLQNGKGTHTVAITRVHIKPSNHIDEATALERPRYLHQN